MDSGLVDCYAGRAEWAGTPGINHGRPGFALCHAATSGGSISTVDSTRMPPQLAHIVITLSSSPLRNKCRNVGPGQFEECRHDMTKDSFILSPPHST